jgi:hypothetical protein
MRPFRFPLGDQKTVATTGNVITWLLATLPLTRMVNGGAKFAHVRGFELTFVLNIVSANGAAALAVVDIMRLITATQFFRNNQLLRIRPATGAQWRIWNGSTANGVDRSIDPNATAVPANSSGSPVTTAITVRVPFFLYGPGLADEDTFVWPTGAYQKGSLQITTGNPTTVWGTNYTLTGTNTVDCDFFLGANDYLHFGADLELYNLDNSITSGTSFTQIDSGAYFAIIVASEKAGGGDDHTLYTSLDSLQYFPDRLPTQSGKQLRADFKYRSPIDLSNNIYVNAQALQLIGPDMYGKATQSPLVARDTWKLNYTVASSLASGVRILFARILDRKPLLDNAEMLSICALYNVDPSKVTEVSKTMGGIVPKGRESYVPVELKPGSRATNRVAR